MSQLPRPGLVRPARTAIGILGRARPRPSPGRTRPPPQYRATSAALRAASAAVRPPPPQTSARAFRRLDRQAARRRRRRGHARSAWSCSWCWPRRRESCVPSSASAAGAVLAAALVGAGWWLERAGPAAGSARSRWPPPVSPPPTWTSSRSPPIYDWVPAPVGLVIAAVVAGGGLTLARRWDSEHLGLLVLVPLIGLAPVVTDGITLLLVGFMLALSAASLPVQLGKDWIGLHARAHRGRDACRCWSRWSRCAVDDARTSWLVGACGIAALLRRSAALCSCCRGPPTGRRWRCSTAAGAASGAVRFAGGRPDASPR